MTVECKDISLQMVGFNPKLKTHTNTIQKAPVQKKQYKYKEKHQIAIVITYNNTTVFS